MELTWKGGGALVEDKVAACDDYNKQWIIPHGATCTSLRTAPINTNPKSCDKDPAASLVCGEDKVPYCTQGNDGEGLCVCVFSALICAFENCLFCFELCWI